MRIAAPADVASQGALIQLRGLLAFCIALCLLALQVFICIAGARMGSDGRSDFRQFYTAGYMVRTGHANQIYDYDIEKKFQVEVAGPGSALPFDHLAYESLIFAPLSFLKFKTAYFVFGALNLLLLALATWMFRPYLSELSAIAPWIPYIAFACFLPVAITLVQAQDSIILLVLMIAAFVCFDRRLNFEAGIFIGLGLFKFQYVIPIVLLFLLWRRWSVVIGATVSGVGVALISLLITGSSATVTFARTLLEMGTGLTSRPQQIKFGTFPERMPNLRGLLYAITQPFSATSTHTAILVAISSVLLIVLAARMSPSLPLAIVVATLVSYHCLIHDTTLLIIPIATVLSGSIYWGKKVTVLSVLAAFIGLPIVFPFMDGRFYLFAFPILALTWAQANTKQPESQRDLSAQIGARPVQSIQPNA